MYSIHLQFADLEIGLKFQNYCHRDGIYCANVTHHDAAQFHVTTNDETFISRLKRLVSENTWLDIV